MSFAVSRVSFLVLVLPEREQLVLGNPELDQARELPVKVVRPRLILVQRPDRQVIDAEGGKVLASASTLEKDVRTSHPNGAKKAAAAEVGKRIAEKAKAAGVTEVAFDRAGFSYHGRVKALAEAAREGGLKF